MNERRVHALDVDAEGRRDLKSLPRDAFVRFVTETLDETPERALAVFKALWQRSVARIDDVPGVRGSTKAALARVATVSMLEPVLLLRSADGTLKFLWKLQDGYTIESVLIPDFTPGRPRLTLCISSQVGCAMACTFCLTGDLGLKRHLKAAEIAGQVMQVQRLLDSGELLPGFRRISNVVLMGMGEPLHNLPNVLPALEILLDDAALNLSHRKITVSTVGLVPQMMALAAALPVNLAVSVNASHEARRREIMPITKKHSLAELMEACRNFPLPPGKRITLEYVMFAGDNDTLDDAARLFDLIQGFPVKLNLIPYNENPDRDLRAPSPEAVLAFQDFFAARGVSTAVRTTRGLDISAACGQLGKAWQQAADRGWLDHARALAGHAPMA
jgi:23S rRNA (adenine2503-C2)-methyltransferase